MKLFSTEYLVTFCEAAREVDQEGKRVAYGYVNFDGKYIRLWNNATVHPDTLLATFLHEMIHIIDNELQTELKERQVALLALGLTAWVRENDIKVLIK